MANYFWVGGNGTWDNATNTNWAIVSGGAGAQGIPTAADNVTFDNLSNATAYVVTLGASPSCLTATIGNPASGVVTLTPSATRTISVNGSLSIASGVVLNDASFGINFNFQSTTTGQTITTNNATLAFDTSTLTFSGLGGAWQFQDNITLSGANSSITLSGGALDLNGKTFSSAAFQITGTNTKSLTMGAASVTVSNSIGWSVSGVTGTSINAGTSTITCSGSTPGLAGGGFAYNNIVATSWASAGITLVINISSANNITIANTSTAFGCAITFPISCTISGTLSIQAAAIAARFFVSSGTLATTTTITAAAVTLVDVDFQDISAAGVASPFTGTRLGDAMGNSNITTRTPTTFYWVGHTANITAANVWATSSGGTGATANFPLPQDNITLDAHSFTSTGQLCQYTFTNRCTNLDTSAVSFSSCSAAFSNLFVLGNLNTGTNCPIGGGGSVTLKGRSAQTLNMTAAPNIQNLNFNQVNATTTLQSDTTLTFITVNLTTGFLDTNGFAITATTWGTGGANVANGTRTVYMYGSMFGNSVSFSTGSYVITVAKAVTNLNNLTFTGFSGTFNLSAGLTMTGDLTFGSSMTWAGSAAVSLTGNLVLGSGMTITYNGTLSFNSTTTKTITSNSNTFAGNIVSNPGSSGTVQLADNLTSTASISITGAPTGALDLNGKNCTALAFSTSNGTLLMGTGSLILSGSGLVCDLSGLAHITPSTSTLKLTNSSASAKSIQTAGRTLYNLWIAPGAGTGSFTILADGNVAPCGGSVFNNIKDDGTAAHSLLFEDSYTFAASSMTIGGSAGNLLTIGSPNSSQFSLAITGTPVTASYVSVSRMNTAPGKPWLLNDGTSVDGGYNLGVEFGVSKVSNPSYSKFPKQLPR